MGLVGWVWVWGIGFGGWVVVMDSGGLVLGSDVLTGFGSGGQRNLVKSDNIFRIWIRGNISPTWGTVSSSWGTYLNLMLYLFNTWNLKYYIKDIELLFYSKYNMYYDLFLFLNHHSSLFVPSVMVIMLSTKTWGMWGNPSESLCYKIIWYIKS